MKDIAICAVIVTYNRLELLKYTIENVLNQSRKVDEIIVINNASTDGTKEFLSTLREITTINLSTNIGGAGGFYEGIKYGVEKGYDYIWIMDDDTICTKCALEKMEEKIKYISNESIGFLASNVLFKDNKPCIMNIPVTKEFWNEHSDKGLIELEATSFVSVLISKEAICEVGLPIKEFFIWGDDFEYTRRISKKFKSYFVCDSIVHHYMNENKGVDILITSKERLFRYYYEFRNKYYIQKIQGKKHILRYYKYLLKTILKILFTKTDGRFKKLHIVIKGWINGIKFNPNIEYINIE